MSERETWIHYWTCEQPIFKHHAQIQRLLKRRRIIGNAARSSLFISEHGLAQMWVTKKGFEDMELDGKKFLDPKKTKPTIADMRNTIKTIWQLTHALQQLIKSDTNIHSKQYCKLFSKYNQAFLTVFAYVLTTWEPVSIHIEKRLKTIINSSIPDTDNIKLTLLTTPSDIDLLLKEKCSLLNLIRKPTPSNIKKHMIRFSFLFTNIESDKDALKLMHGRIKKQSAAELSKEINTSVNRLKKLKHSQNKIYKKLHSPEAKRLACLIQELGLLRLELKNCWAGVHYSIYDLFKNIAAETNNDVKDIMMFWTFDDIEGFLKHKKPVSRQELSQRKDYYLLYLNGKQYGYYSGSKARTMAAKLLKRESSETIKSFKGNIANKGLATGKVLIVDFDDLRVIEQVAQKITEPFVLVTGMTNPNSVPLIKKSIAIITDEGGITCHAAIISREFKIPCVIGTRVATQVLKTGDIVEVNANEGIITIIKKAVTS